MKIEKFNVEKGVLGPVLRLLSKVCKKMNANIFDYSTMYRRYRSKIIQKIPKIL